MNEDPAREPAAATPYAPGRGRMVFGVVQTVALVVMAVVQLGFTTLTMMLPMGCEYEPDAFRCSGGVTVAANLAVFGGGILVAVVGLLVTWLPRRRPTYWGLLAGALIQLPTLGFGAYTVFFG